MSSPIAIILTEDNKNDKRVVVYETMKRDHVVIFEETLENNCWVYRTHIKLPIVMVDMIQSFRFEKAFMKGDRYDVDFVTSFKREFIFRVSELELAIRKICYDYDVEDIPMYENQEGYWRDLDAIEKFWDISITESPITCETSTSYSYATPVTTTKNSDIVDSSTDTPPISLCYAPKKRKTNSSLEKEFEDW